MTSDFDNRDIMVGRDNINPIEIELAGAIEESSVQYDTESNIPPSKERFSSGERIQKPKS